MWFFSDLERTIADVKRQFSAKDAEGVRKYVEFWKAFAAGVGQGFYNPPLSYGQLFGLFGGAGPEAEDALKKAFFCGSVEYLDELIESEN